MIASRLPPLAFTRHLLYLVITHGSGCGAKTWDKSKTMFGVTIAALFPIVLLSVNAAIHNADTIINGDKY